MSTFVIGYVFLPSSELAVALVQCVMERLGHHVRLVEGTADECLARFAAGEIHAVGSATLQLAGPEWEPVRRDVVEIAGFSGGHHFWWSVPNTPAMRGVRTIAQLPGAPIRREVVTVLGGPTALQSRNAMRAYGLEAAGFRLREDTMAHFLTICREAAADPQGPVIAHPSHHTLPEGCDYRPLEDPLGALGGEFRTSLVSRRVVADALPRRTREVLLRVTPSVTHLTHMETELHKLQCTPRALVRSWLDSNPEIWSGWLAAEPARVPAMA